jgi:hypothetical protein
VELLASFSNPAIIRVISSGAWHGKQGKPTAPQYAIKLKSIAIIAES